MRNSLFKLLTTLHRSSDYEYFPSREMCCALQLPWSKTCRLSVSSYSNKYYVDGSVCVKDCDTSNGGSCGGNPSDDSLRLFDTPELCCATSLSWTNQGECVSAAKGEVYGGSGLWVSTTTNQPLLMLFEFTKVPHR
jgi:hypothetical protein